MSTSRCELGSTERRYRYSVAPVHRRCAIGLLGTLIIGSCAANPVGTFSEERDRVDQVVEAEMGKDAYGGMLITTDGIMVVALTETPDSRVLDLIETAARPRTVRIIRVKYSYEQLVSWGEQMQTVWELPPSSFFLDVERNQVRIVGAIPDLPVPPGVPNDAVNLSGSG